MRRHLLLFLLCLMVFPTIRAEEMPPPEPTDPPGFWTKALWYIPNRVLDLLDIVRLRAKFGPGLGAGVRVTDYAAFYAGSENTIWLGLPGPRYPNTIQEPWGRDQRHGLVLIGVDASDDRPYGPGYETTESGLSLHAGLVGFDAGISFNELGDFVAGIFGADPRDDDLPRPKRPSEVRFTSVLGISPAIYESDLRDKPVRFESLPHRLDYLWVEAPGRVGRHLHAFDAQFAEEGEKPLPHPRIDNLQFAIHMRTLHGPDPSYTVRPKLKLHIDLPNLERKVNLFIESSFDEDELPGRDIEERRDLGLTIGARGRNPQKSTYTDIGIHAKVPPKLFARAGWRPRWTWGDWTHQFDQRVFWESKDGLGTLSSFQFYRWVAPKWLFRSLSAGRYAEGTEGYEWQQSLGIGYIADLANERKRLENTGPSDILRGVALESTLFGSDDASTQFRTVIIYRRTLYHDFVVLQISPGVQWRDEQQWQIEYRLDCGLVLLF